MVALLSNETNLDVIYPAQLGQPVLLPVSRIVVDPDHERRNEALIGTSEGFLDLRAHVKAHGVLQPIQVYASEATVWTLISGYRRWLASKAVGLTHIPAFIERAPRTPLERHMKRVASNTLREKINDLELAITIESVLKANPQLSQQEVAAQFGISQPHCSNLLRVFRAPEPLRDLLRKDQITMGHARALLGITLDELTGGAPYRLLRTKLQAQLDLAAKVMAEDMSVHELEGHVTRYMARQQQILRDKGVPPLPTASLPMGEAPLQKVTARMDVPARLERQEARAVQPAPQPATPRTTTVNAASKVTQPEHSTETWPVQVAPSVPSVAQVFAPVELESDAGMFQCWLFVCQEKGCPANFPVYNRDAPLRMPDKVEAGQLARAEGWRFIEEGWLCAYHASRSRSAPTRPEEVVG